MYRRLCSTANQVCSTTLTFLLAVSTSFADDRQGKWGPVLDWNINPIHAILTPGNTLLTYGQGGGVEYSVWHIGMGPETFSRTLLDNETGTDLFCASQIVLPETATVMMTGGDQLGGGNPGNPNTTIFDDQDNSMLDAGITMAFPRWYPTTITLPNGEILAQGGRAHDNPDQPVLTPEIFHPATGWRTLDDATSEFAYGGFKWWYPRSWVLPNGLVFGISGSSMFYVDYLENGDTVSAGKFNKEHTYETSTAVMYRPGKILQLGGGPEGNVDGTPSLNTASFIDVTGNQPVVTDAPSLHFSRHWADTTILPDGNVLVSGGSQLNNSLEGTGPVFTPELWDVDTNTWSLMAAETIPRLYHSFAILLPDATVITGGGGEPGPLINKNAQIYSPPYLFDGNEPAQRPQIEVTNKTLQYGGAVEIRNLSSHSIERVTLVKTGSVTHSFNSDQRFIELDVIKHSEQHLSATLPDSPTIATPGYYLLFAIDSNGTPSVAEFVHFPPDYSYIPPPSPVEFCENIESPGSISGNQQVSAYSQPQALYSMEDAWGGLDGDIEYQWVRSNIADLPASSDQWLPIQDAHDKWLLPPSVQETTYFARHARRNECYSSFMTNIVAVEVAGSEARSISSLATDVLSNASTSDTQSDPSQSHCSYRDAHFNDGWGWDPINRQSCPPLP